jgi:hypothetical protein
MKNILLGISLLFICNSMSAQTPNKNACNSPEATQFDFWLGTWEGYYSDTLKPALNSITKPIGNCVIEENFKDPNNGFLGKSFSVFNPQTKKWQQTWVDNQAGYITLTGEFKDGSMQLNTEVLKPNGSKVWQRMIYFNIKDDSFDWNWEASTDEGKTWTVNWQIHYKRMKFPPAVTKKKKQYAHLTPGLSLKKERGRA